MLNVCGTTFIRNAFQGGFCLFESMAAVLSLVDEFHLVDFGSTDGTLEICREIAAKNPRIKIHQRTWTNTSDPSTFADAANECVDICPTEAVLFYQADEVFHENLIRLIREAYSAGDYALNFERIQLSHNFNQIKWLPHAVVRSVLKSKYRYAGDGMTVGDSGGTRMMCRNPETGVFGNSRQYPWHQFWCEEDPRRTNDKMAAAFPWDEFLVDTSSSFLENQIGKKQLHAPFWREDPNNINGKRSDKWYKDASVDPIWLVKTSPFPLPKIIQGLVGMPKYELRDEVRAVLEKDDYSPFGL